MKSKKRRRTENKDSFPTSQTRFAVQNSDTQKDAETQNKSADRQKKNSTPKQRKLNTQWINFCNQNGAFMLTCLFFQFNELFIIQRISKFCYNFLSTKNIFGEKIWQNCHLKLDSDNSTCSIMNKNYRVPRVLQPLNRVKGYRLAASFIDIYTVSTSPLFTLGITRYGSLFDLTSGRKKSLSTLVNELYWLTPTLCITHAHQEINMVNMKTKTIQPYHNQIGFDKILFSDYDGQNNFGDAKILVEYIDSPNKRIIDVESGSCTWNLSMDVHETIGWRDNLLSVYSAERKTVATFDTRIKWISLMNSRIGYRRLKLRERPYDVESCSISNIYNLIGAFVDGVRLLPSILSFDMRHQKRTFLLSGGQHVLLEVTNSTKIMLYSLSPKKQQNWLQTKIFETQKEVEVWQLEEALINLNQDGSFFLHRQTRHEDRAILFTRI